MTKAQLITDLQNMIGPGVEVDASGLTTWLNDSYSYVCDQISQANPDYFSKAATGTLIAGQAEYALPSDYLRMLMVELNQSGTWARAFPLPGIGNLAASEDPASQGYSTGAPVYYLYAGIIGYRPVPTSSSDSQKIWYVYTPSELVADSDIPAIPSTYHHLLKYGAYATYLDEDDQHAAAEAMRTRFDTRILNMLDSMGSNQLDETKSVQITGGYGLYNNPDRNI
jgi:hypothetical protein